MLARRTQAETEAPVAYPRCFRRRARVAWAAASSRYPMLLRTPWIGGSSPVKIETWDGSVKGHWLQASSKRMPSCRSRSIAGVSTLR